MPLFILAISDNMEQAGLIMLVTTAETCKPLDLTSHKRSPAGKNASATQPHPKSATDTGLNDASSRLKVNNRLKVSSRQVPVLLVMKKANQNDLYVLMALGFIR